MPPKYLRYVTLQAGLGGIITRKTPREIIEGYNNTLIQNINDLSIFNGGDQTQNKFISWNYDITNP